MTVTPLLALALYTTVSFAPYPSNDMDPLQMTARQKSLAVERLIRNATDCVVRKVASDPRLSRSSRGNLGDLIVDSMPSCVASVRAMIDAYDRFYGAGAGEAFFSGTYLEILPQAVSRSVIESQAK